MSDTDYSETVLFIAFDDGGGKAPTYNLTGSTETKPVARQGSRIAFQLPFGEPSAAFEGDKFTAALEGQFVDYWERVRRLSVCGERSYHFCLARRAGEPVGYVAVRRLKRGSSRQLGRIPGAIVTDLVAVDDEPAVLRALSARAATVASELGAAVVLAVTSRPSQREALVSAGFLSPDFPLLGRPLMCRSPQYMWVPKGPGTHISAGTIALKMNRMSAVKTPNLFNTTMSIEGNVSAIFLPIVDPHFDF